MLKKMIFWFLYLTFVVGLVLAAINRTSVTLEESDKNRVIDLTGGTAIQISESATSHSKEQHNLENADTHEHIWEILSGEVTVLSNRGATIILENGVMISLNPRSWRFAQDHGFQAQIGDMLLLTGFDENEKFEIVHLRNLDNGTVVQIRDEAGHPLWVSGGNGE